MTEAVRTLLRFRPADFLRGQPFDTSTEDGRAKERLRRAALTTAASVGAKLIAMAANLISIPLTLNYLGAERFGLWVTISSANALLEFADLGLGNGLLNAIASGSARNDRPALQRHVSSAFFILLGIALLIAVCFWTITPVSLWHRVFGQASPALVSEARDASAMFIACFAISLPLGIVRRVQMGYQEGFASNLWQCVASVLSLLSLLVALRMNAGLPVLVLCLTGAPAVALGLNWLVEFGYHRPWLLPRWSLFEWTTGWRLIRDGLMFVILQIGSISLATADPLIAARFVGLAAVADFAVAQRLFMLTVAMQNMWLVPLWPAYGEAAARGDTGWVRRTLLRTTLVAVVSSAIAGSVLVVFRSPIFGAWLHRGWAPPAGLSVALACCTVVLAAGAATSMYLNGVNAIREQAGMVSVMTIVVVILKVELCRHFGIVGIPWGMFVGYTAIMAPFLTVLIHRRLRRDDKLSAAARLETRG